MLSLDLASLSSVRKFAAEVCQITSKVDILVNNAGIMIGEGRGTEDGLELHMQVCNLTKKYPLRGHILGVLMHTTAWD